ncbi:hypothetical protein, partial [Exiguobacterium acetylicum]|uniref:hypothetical protein n=1 Tax=Exiguobacterium acetylicum TaxID=41170 RepID=UPI0006A4A5A6
MRKVIILSAVYLSLFSVLNSSDNGTQKNALANDHLSTFNHLGKETMKVASEQDYPGAGKATVKVASEQDYPGAGKATVKVASEQDYPGAG